MSEDSQLYVGDIWEPLFKLKHRGVLADPTTVLVDFQDPQGEVTQVEATREATGEWTAPMPLDSNGTWHATPRAAGSYTGVGTIERTVLNAPLI